MIKRLLTSGFLLLLGLSSCIMLSKLPSVLNVRILGVLEVGQALVGSYTYSHPRTEEEGASNFQWYRTSTDSPSDLEPIAGADEIEYEITWADVGKRLLFEVTPVDARGRSGSAVISPSTKEVPLPVSLTIEDKTVNTESFGTLNILGHRLGDGIRALEIILEHDTAFIDILAVTEPPDQEGNCIVTFIPTGHDHISHILVGFVNPISVTDSRTVARLVFVAESTPGITELSFSSYSPDSNGDEISSSILREDETFVEGVNLSKKGMITIYE